MSRSPYRAAQQGRLAPRWIWALCAIVVACWWLSSSPPSAVDPGPGQVAPNAPQQGPVRGKPPATIGDFHVTALYSFTAEARVLGREDYRIGTEALLSPVDLALGWGRMSDSAVLDQLKITQGGRFYHYRWGASGAPIPPPEIVRSSANMHMIPADDEVAAQLRQVAVGSVVRFEGWLVRIDRDDGWRWVSSTTREDSGAGACELVLVTSLSLR